MRYIFLTSFLRRFKAYQKPEQEIINETIESLKTYLETNRASYGLRIKRLSHRIFEARIDIKLRIAFFRQKDELIFFCLGNHDDIARCLKHLRSILSKYRV